jgi:limonene-1,2-epoxide hydrolase
MNENVRIARDFIETWRRKDVEAMVAACTEDVVYQNVPTPPIEGREALRAFMSVNMPKCDAFESEVLAIAATADEARVLTERHDAFVFDGRRVDIPVMGIFELRGGKISAWRDYFDVGTYAGAMRAAGAEAGPGMAENY